MKLLAVFFSLITFSGFAQQIKIEYDKKHDFSGYKTFSFGQSQITTPADQKQVTDAVMDKWIRNGVIRELEHKGLKAVDKDGDLLITYVVSNSMRRDSQVVPPLGHTPDSNDRTWSRDYMQTTLILDMNNHHRDLVWRVNAVVDALGKDAERTIDLIIVKGFKKYKHLGK